MEGRHVTNSFFAKRGTEMAGQAFSILVASASIISNISYVVFPFSCRWTRGEAKAKLSTLIQKGPFGPRDYCR